MILNSEQIMVGAKSMLVGGRVQDWSERDDIGVVDHDEVVRICGFLQVLELVDDDVYHTSSWVFVQLLMESRC